MKSCTFDSELNYNHAQSLFQQFIEWAADFVVLFHLVLCGVGEVF